MEFRLGTAYHGPVACDLAEALAEFGGIARLERPPDPAAAFVADIEREPVAWVAGPSEIGPRALGHRSLLADPRCLASKDTLNAVKERQWWRPVAPVVLAEDVADWFETSRQSCYMLETARVRAGRAELVPAIAHLDGSARLQTLTTADDPLLHAMLTAFRDRTGVPMLCNTSLNGPGQPIIQTVQQALAFCAERAISVCYVDGQRVAVEPAAAAGSAPRYDFPPAPAPAPATAPAPGDAGAQESAALNPHGLTGPELYHLMVIPSLGDADITTPAGAARVRAAAASHYDRFPSDLRWVSSYLRRLATWFAGRSRACGPDAVRPGSGRRDRFACRRMPLTACRWHSFVQATIYPGQATGPAAGAARAVGVEVDEAALISQSRISKTLHQRCRLRVPIWEVDLCVLGEQVMDV
jgi:hypothetical protein